MTTPTDLAQALRELIPYAAECAACPSYRIKNARAALQAHESRAQPAINHDDVDDVLSQVHGLARKINDDPDEATNASADILTIIEKARSPRRGLLAAQPASVADAVAAMAKAVRPIAKAITPTVPRPFKGNIWELEGNITIGECKAFIEAVYALAAAPQPAKESE